MNTPQKIETELRIIAHGDILPLIEPDPSEDEALIRIVANTSSLETKTNDLSSRTDGKASDDGNG